jgi:D-psicose/D-tagatose/L-ribulose 3-epimerase
MTEASVKIGFCMFLWGPVVTPAQRPIFEQLKATGYTGVEIPIVSGDLQTYREIGGVLDGIGLERTSLTVLPHGKNPLSDDRAERQAAVEARAPLRLSSLGGRPAASRGILIAVEAMNRFEAHCLNTMDQLVAYLDRVDHPAVTGMFDTFHANIEERDPAAAITRSLRRIAHVQISENDRGTPGRGPLQCGAIFAALKRGGYDGWLTIEAFGRASPEFAAKTRVWRELSANATDCCAEGYRHVFAGWDTA